MLKITVNMFGDAIPFIFEYDAGGVMTSRSPQHAVSVPFAYKTMADVRAAAQKSKAVKIIHDDGEE
jgi:hypothetical protein